jgi:hypothetical protein
MWLIFISNSANLPPLLLPTVDNYFWHPKILVQQEISKSIAIIYIVHGFINILYCIVRIKPIIPSSHGLFLHCSGGYIPHYSSRWLYPPLLIYEVAISPYLLFIFKVAISPTVYLQGDYIVYYVSSYTKPIMPPISQTKKRLYPPPSDNTELIMPHYLWLKEAIYPHHHF